MVQILLKHNQISGRHDEVWNAESIMNSIVPSGIYIYQLTVDGVISGTRKMVLVKEKIVLINLKLGWRGVGSCFSNLFFKTKGWFQ